MASAVPYTRAVRTVTAATAKQQMLRQLVCSDAPEQALRYHGFRVIAGVDEVGHPAVTGNVEHHGCRPVRHTRVGVGVEHERAAR